MISLSHVGKFYGKQDVLKEVSLSIHTGERIALVGVNGAGKTTLLKLLLGTMEPDNGLVHRKKGLRLGYLPQDVIELTGKTVLQQVMEVNASVQQVLAEFNKITHKLDQTTDQAECQILDFGKNQYPASSIQYQGSVYK